VSPSPKTVKVRVALVVATDGSWNAAGWSFADYSPASQDVIDTAFTSCYGPEGGEAVYWLEAEVPVPVEAEPVTVQAVATPSEEARS
jgi:hypothetical protein